jgi:DNA-directed RNA polymerase subunit RPC12/RpoP
MRLLKKDEPFVEYEVFNSTGTYPLVVDQWLLPSGMAYSGDEYGFPIVRVPPKSDNIIKYMCVRCGSKLLVNRDKVPAIMSLNCFSCGSSDLKEI